MPQIANPNSTMERELMFSPSRIDSLRSENCVFQSLGYSTHNRKASDIRRYDKYFSAADLATQPRAPNLSLAITIRCNSRRLLILGTQS
jgi:hypothetical protein